jgi:hypothetical protein
LLRGQDGHKTVKPLRQEAELHVFGRAVGEDDSVLRGCFFELQVLEGKRVPSRKKSRQAGRISRNGGRKTGRRAGRISRKEERNEGRKTGRQKGRISRKKE